MNKKFSTLLCASLLLSSAFTTVNAGNIKDYALGSDAAKITKLDEAALKGMYQLRTKINSTDYVLVIEDGKYALKKVTSSTRVADLQSSLWCITITEEGQGKEPIYDFVNKATGEFLAISEADVEGLEAGKTTTAGLSVGETYGGWAFSSTYKNSLETEQPMFTYVEADYVLLLVQVRNQLQVKKVKASDVASETTALKFTVFNAGTYVLSADEINGYLKDNKNVLSFAPDAKADVNPFSTNAFVAKEIENNKSSDHNFVYVISKEDEDMYLKVDTAANGVGIGFLKFGWTDNSKNKVDGSDLEEQHKFLFTYKPSVDSLFIQVKEARYKDEKQPEKYWSEIKDAKKYGTNYADITKDDATMDAVNKDCVPSQLFVKLQDFTTSASVVTIGERPINTKIGFGLENCFTTSDKTSVDNGLYVIKNEKNQVLAAPIHKNAEGANNYTIEWVTLDEQEPLHMPAYQWVITKTLSAEVSQETSPVKIVNREFPAAKAWNNVQFRLNEDGEIYTTTAGATELNKVTFVQITDSAIIKDKKLGYKYIESKDLQVNKYKFNYLNPFSMDQWIANGEEGDSLIYVKEDAGSYILEEGCTRQYGITVDAALLKKIPGLAQLERTNYVIAKDDQARLVKAYGSKYAMGIENYKTIKSDLKVDTFFFKENNHYDGKDFYAIVESYYNKTEKTTQIRDIAKYTEKVGIADDGMSAGLKVQLLNETRTSAFTVEPSTTPLYRRFNNTALTESATDGPDSLRFYENARHEYLMDENNPNWQNEGMSYLGMWTADKATGLSFRIDTAWVNRGNGDIKPQYLISVARNDFEGKEGEPCTEDGPHFDINGNETTPDKCVHAHPAIPRFDRGQYLVSFQDSVDHRNGKIVPFTDVKGGYTRVGFLEGIRQADTLWILPNEFKNIANDKIDFAALAKADSICKADHGWSIKNILTGDQHKNYTWSFRYVNPEDAGNVTEEGADNSFLIESNIYPSVPKPTVNSIAPETKAAWLKIQNGCVVLTDETSVFANAKTGGDGALVFNVENIADDELATDNEDITLSEVKVIAGAGQITINGAAGKKVVVSNILGQVVANTVLTSDNATIAAPQGVVVVAVEGKEAVKAIVK